MTATAVPSERVTVKVSPARTAVSSSAVRLPASVLRSVRLACPATGGAGSVLNQTLSSRLPSRRSPLPLDSARKKNRLTYCPTRTV